MHSPDPKILDYSVNLMPAMIQSIARVSTPPLAVRFARQFGGQMIYFPEKLARDHRLVRVLGSRAATQVCRVWLRETVEVPAAKAYLRWFDVRCLAVLGLTHMDIRERMGLSYRHVQRLLEQFDPTTIVIDDTVMEVGRLYQVRPRDAERARRNRTLALSLQGDFGWPRAPAGAPIHVV